MHIKFGGKMINYDSSYIISKTLNSLNHYIKLNRELLISEEVTQKLTEFLESKDVSKGIQYLIVAELKREPDIEFNAELKDLSGNKEEKTIRATWDKNPKWGYRENLLCVSIKKSAKETFVNYGKRRGVPLIEEIANAINCSQPMQIWVFKSEYEFQRSLRMLNDYRREGIFFGQQPYKGDFDIQKPIAYFHEQKRMAFVYNADAEKSIEIHKYTPRTA